MIKAVLMNSLALVKRNVDFKDVSRLRLGMEVATAFLPTFQEGVHFKSLKIAEINCKWVIPPHVDEEKVLLYFHGGGYAVGSVQTHKSLLTQISKHAGVKGLIFDYRLSPEHQFPAALEDAVQVYLWLIENGYSPENIAFGGDSAGGGLAIATMLYIRDHQNASLPACCVALSPWLDLTCTNPSILKNEKTDVMLSPSALHHMAINYLGKEDMHNPYASPIFADLKGLSPIYLQVCEVEILYDDSVLFAEKAKAAGIEIEMSIYGNLLHSWQTFWPFFAEGREANKQLGEYLKKKLAVKLDVLA